MYPPSYHITLCLQLYTLARRRVAAPLPRSTLSFRCTLLFQLQRRRRRRLPCGRHRSHMRGWLEEPGRLAAVKRANNAGGGGGATNERNRKTRRTTDPNCSLSLYLSSCNAPSPSFTLIVSVLILHRTILWSARNVLSYTRGIIQNFLAFRDSPIISLRRSISPSQSFNVRRAPEKERKGLKNSGLFFFHSRSTEGEQTLWLLSFYLCMDYHFTHVGQRIKLKKISYSVFFVCFFAACFTGWSN